MGWSIDQASSDTSKNSFLFIHSDEATTRKENVTVLNCNHSHVIICTVGSRMRTFPEYLITTFVYQIKSFDRVRKDFLKKMRIVDYTSVRLHNI